MRTRLISRLLISLLAVIILYIGGYVLAYHAFGEQWGEIELVVDGHYASGPNQVDYFAVNSKDSNLWKLSDAIWGRFAAAVLVLRADVTTNEASDLIGFGIVRESGTFSIFRQYGLVYSNEYHPLSGFTPYQEGKFKYDE